MLREFLRELDGRWGPRSVREKKIRLRIIGSAALMLQTDYARGTKDSDVLETAELTGDVRERLEALGGKGSELYARHRMYVDIVSLGLPFLPQRPLCHELAELNAKLRCLEFEVLDVVDVVVSKLKRFSASDRGDIEAMVRQEKLPHDVLVERFRSAVDVYACDARAEDLPKYVRALHRVERDLLDVPETAIELPAWVADDE